MKRFQKFLVVTMAILLANFASALEISDVKSNHWAAQEIIHAIQNGYIQVVDGNKFKPEATMSRAEFVTSLLKVIRRQDEPIVQKTTFKDIKSSTPDKHDIVLSEQIRMAFGYPDKTFRPNRNINHNETMAMIANITKNDFSATDISRFDDYKEIPVWATRSYIKNVANNLYINYPDEMKFKPSQDLTRAEAAVIFDRVAENVDKFLDKYRDMYDSLSSSDGNGNGSDWDDFNKSEFLADNTLALAPFATNNKVKIYDNKKVIEAGNILIATDITKVASRKDYVGDTYVFTAPNDVYSVQGEFLYPKGTEFYARDEKKGYSAWRSKPEKSNVVFFRYSMPTGQVYDMAGVPFTKDDKIIYVNSVKNAKQAKKYSADKSSSKNYLIKCAHQMNPILDYKMVKGKTIYLLLTGDMIIPQNEEYYNLRTKKKSVLEEEI
ncbi:MAG: S-layer homology domain-containing protein [Candidatus Gastranaerophilales bacterium]|nr:S-layer homology domain-containing protein [Candidatus Gastranaerophilales bacterium]